LSIVERLPCHPAPLQASSVYSFGRNGRFFSVNTTPAYYKNNPAPAPEGSTNLLSQRYDRAAQLQVKQVSDPDKLTEEEQTFLREFYEEQLNKVKKPTKD